jgi:hypothetical protein
LAFLFIWETTRPRYEEPDSQGCFSLLIEILGKLPAMIVPFVAMWAIPGLFLERQIRHLLRISDLVWWPTLISIAVGVTLGFAIDMGIAYLLYRWLSWWWKHSRRRR